MGQSNVELEYRFIFSYEIYALFEGQLDCIFRVTISLGPSSCDESRRVCVHDDSRAFRSQKLDELAMSERLRVWQWHVVVFIKLTRKLRQVQPLFHETFCREHPDKFGLKLGQIIVGIFLRLAICQVECQSSLL